jgi:hypothetical protein
MRRSLLLGRDFLNAGNFICDCGSYDFVNAALSSIAFPVIFAPRTEAEIMPGSGRADVLLADGGMFDNMPFYPALDLLGAMQAEYRNKHRPGEGNAAACAEALGFLAERQQAPDLLIAAGLDAPAGYQPIRRRSNLSDNFARVKSFGKNVKSSSFGYLSDRVGKQAQVLLEQTSYGSRDKEALSLGRGFVPFIDSIVSAGVLQIFPTDAEHVNQTFAFSRSIGMNKERVCRSIADGCFQTMLSIVEAQTALNGKLREDPEQHGSATLKASIRGLTGSRVPALRIVNRDAVVGDEECPFFQRKSSNTGDSESIGCPFVDPD